MFAFGWTHSRHSVVRVQSENVLSPVQGGETCGFCPQCPKESWRKLFYSSFLSTHDTSPTPSTPWACDSDVGSLLQFLCSPSSTGGYRWMVFGLMGSFFPPTPLPCSAIVSDSGHTKETPVLPWELKPEEWAPIGMQESLLMLLDTSINFSWGPGEKHSVSNSRLIWV